MSVHGAAGAVLILLVAAAPLACLYCTGAADVFGYYWRRGSRLSYTAAQISTAVLVVAASANVRYLLKEALFR